MRPFKTTPFPLESTFTHTHTDTCTFPCLQVRSTDAALPAPASLCWQKIVTHVPPLLAFVPSLSGMFMVSTLLRGRVLSSFFSASVCLSSLCLLAGFWGVGGVGGWGGMLTFIATATTQYVLLHFHTCYAACTFSCTSTHTSCYAAALRFPHLNSQNSCQAKFRVQGLSYNSAIFGGKTLKKWATMVNTTWFWAHWNT